jgi:predicted O-methyltransferase YrrM
MEKGAVPMPRKPNANRQWAAVDSYFEDLLLPANDALDATLQTNREAGLPSIDISPLLGRFLELLVRISGARRILEIGTLGGYSTIWLARALPADGHLITLELEPRHAEIARTNLQRAGVSDQVEIRLGRAGESLATLVTEKAQPFDFIFIDADKTGYPEYLGWSLKLSRPGTVIVADNLVRNGKVIEPANPDPNIQGVRRFTELMAAEPRLRATVMQNVARRGYDGFSLAVVREDPR